MFIRKDTTRRFDISEIGDKKMNNQIGVIGLGTMGKALAKNLLSRDFKVAGFNRSYETTCALKSEAGGNFSGYEKLEDFVSSLELPKKIIMMLPAGAATDSMTMTLSEILSPGDVLMDGGNAYYKDTERRQELMKQKGVHFYGVGVSGGESGALKGPSIMPGGDKDDYHLIAPFLETISAKKNGEPCCRYIGPGGAGHYVKMVHNGIEYADMQMLAEVYLYLKEVTKLGNDEISKTFDAWNKTEAKSYLVEISSIVTKERYGDGYLVDSIVDKAAQKGTGRWTVTDASQQGQNVSLIEAAVQARITSNLTKEREVLSAIPPASCASTGAPDTCELLDAYFLAKLVAYAQGFAQMKDASNRYSWELNLKEIASIFRAGCIIQAELLELLMELYGDDETLSNFLLHPKMLKRIEKSLPALRHVVLTSVAAGIPVPVLCGAITYIDQLRNKQCGANLIQAQRDFFGAHTFILNDREGAVHYDWSNK